MLLSGYLYNTQCRWSLDDRYPLRMWRTPFEVDHLDRVFLRHEMIDFFLHNRPSAKVVLVVHNSDQTFTESDFHKVSPYVAKVYAVNCEAVSAIPLPLGFRDDQYASHSVLKAIGAEPPVPRTIPVLLNFLLATNPTERTAAYDAFKDKPFCHSDPEYLHMDYAKSLTFTDKTVIQKRVDFYRTLKRCRFAICPPGNGKDTHRIYECIYLGVIPIVKTSFLDRLYRQLPVWIVQEWSDVTEITINRLFPPIQWNQYDILQGMFEKPQPIPIVSRFPMLVSPSL